MHVRLNGNEKEYEMSFLDEKNDRKRKYFKNGREEFERADIMKA